MAETLGSLPSESQAFALLVGITLALAGLALVFGLYAVLLRLAHQRRGRRWRELEGRWEEPLLAALADPGALPAVWERVEERYRLHFVDYVLRFARRVRGEERAVLERAAEPYLDLLAPRLAHRQTLIRVRAVQTLGLLGLPRYIDEMIRALDDPEPIVAMVAARALARPDYEEHAHELMARLEKFGRWRRSVLASLLVGFGPGAVPALAWTLADTNRAPWVRAVAAEALRLLADPSVADAAAAVVEREGGRELMATSLRLLARVGRPEHAAAVRTCARSPDFVIRSQAMSTLGELGSDEDVPLLADAVADPSPWVAIHAARGLRASGGADALASLARGEGEGAAAAREVLEEESVGGSGP